MKNEKKKKLFRGIFFFFPFHEWKLFSFIIYVDVCWSSASWENSVVQPPAVSAGHRSAVTARNSTDNNQLY
jgi:hypothetical protein